MKRKGLLLNSLQERREGADGREREGERERGGKK